MINSQMGRKGKVLRSCEWLLCDEMGQAEAKKRQVERWRRGERKVPRYALERY